VRQDSLQEVGFRFKPVDVTAKRVTFEAVADQDANAVAKLSDLLASASSAAAKQKPVEPCGFPQLTQADKIIDILPATARMHVESNPGHTTRQRCDKGQIRFVLDLPRPVPVDLRPRRCLTCRTTIGSETSNYFPVAGADMERVLRQLGKIAITFFVLRSSVIL
jgi:hypothetical protein